MSILTSIKNIFNGVFGKTATATQEPPRIIPEPRTYVPIAHTETAFQPAQAANVDTLPQKENKQLVGAVAVDSATTSQDKPVHPAQETFEATIKKVFPNMNIVLLITTLISSIKAIEAIMPNSPGVDKMNSVIATIEAIFGSVTAILPQLQALIAILVTGFNAVGLFAKKPAA